MSANDRIVYLKVNDGGGVDGKDPSNKGGEILQASYLETQIKLDSRSHLEKRVIDMEELRIEVENKLNPLELLALNFSGNNIR